MDSQRCGDRPHLHLIRFIGFPRSWLLCGKREEAAMADETGALAYLVRMWSVHHNGDLIWRASADSRVRLHFLAQRVGTYDAANRSTAYQ